MKWRHSIRLVLSLIIVISSTLVVSCTEKVDVSTPIIKDVTTQEAFNLIQDDKNNLDFIIVDVRTSTEFADGHIENAINIDSNSGVFKEEVSKLDRAKKYLVYCRSGNRSRGAINLMKELQFQYIYHMYEGIIGWTNAGYPIV